MTSEDKKTLLLFLGSKQPFEFMGSMRYSTLVAALRECRISTKRNINTGDYNSNIEHGDLGSWLGTIGYFTILDMLGGCFENSRGSQSRTTKKIKFAIEEFAYELINNDPLKLNALIALRNALIHDFNLLNIPQYSNPTQQHKFTVFVDTESNSIVSLPDHPWNGDIEGKIFADTSDSTFVNLFGVGNLVESVYSKICNLIKKNKIELKIPILELINKYTFMTSEHPKK